ncbi:MAG TPA: cytochrome c [Gemmatimonadales bacterium]|nr:cytochrome c [Gemmatimonadales bacterium]
MPANRSSRLWIPALLCAVAPLAGQDPVAPVMPLPSQVTDSAVARGRELFHGSANCVACHGLEGIGTDSGPALAQGVWLHGSDSFEGILNRVIHGLPKAWTTRGVTMPMRGWAELTDAQARDVAAYVWRLSHAWAAPAAPHPPS